LRDVGDVEISRLAKGAVMAGVPGSSGLHWVAEIDALLKGSARSVSAPRGRRERLDPSRLLRDRVGTASGRACFLSSSRNRYLTRVRSDERNSD
jgi:hypothetical protein